MAIVGKPEVEEWFRRAASLRAEGKPNAALEACEYVLSIEPHHVAALSVRAHSLRMLNRYSEAESAARRAIECNGEYPAAWFNLGAALEGLARTHEAIRAYERAIGLQRSYPEAWNNLALALGALGRVDEEIAALRTAAEVGPSLAPIWSNLGDALRRAGRAQEALTASLRAVELQRNSAVGWNNVAASYLAVEDYENAETASREALTLAPDLAHGWSNLGTALRGRRNYEGAVHAFRRALELQPGTEHYLRNLGLALHDKGELAAAAAAYREAIAVSSAYTPGLASLAVTYLALGETQLALDACEQVLAADTADAGSWTAAGHVFASCNDTRRALDALKRAVKLDPQSSAAWRNLGHVNEELGRCDTAIAAYRRAAHAVGDRAAALAALAWACMNTCRWDELESTSAELDAALDVSGENTRAAEMPLANVTRRMDPAINMKVARSWAAELERGHPAAVEFRRREATSARLRIGYLSGDLHDHATAHLTGGLYAAHDRSRFEIHAYSYGGDDGSKHRERIAMACDAFHDVRALSHRAAAQRVFDDGVDILVDLKGWTREHRLEICALRPSPVQMTYLGFPGTTGARFFDYALVDQTVVPESHQQYYTERLIRLPHCYQVNDATRRIAEEELCRRDFGLPEEGIVFCSFNQPVKIGREMFRAWMHVLENVPGSVLWLLVGNSYAENALKQEAAAAGVAPERLVFAGLLPVARHLRRLQLADIALDTQIYNGHTTTSDALWAGIPVVTLRGSHFASRVSASCLAAAGLPQLIASTFGEFVALATRLGSDPQALQALKTHLGTQRMQVPLFDTRRFVRNLESAFDEAWRRYCCGMEPDHFAIIEPPSDGD